MTGSPPTLDVSHLPPVALDTRAPAWWGNTLFMVIETTTMSLLLVSYFYTWRAGELWPPPLADAGPNAHSPLPGRVASSTNMVLLLATCWPARRVELAARRGDRFAVRNGLMVLVVLGLAAIGLRFSEFPSLQVRWDDNAYGSLVWTILGMHLTYIIVATLEVLVTTIWVIFYEFEEDRAFEVTLTSIYWYWMVGLWVPFYLVVYWAPRLL